MGCSPSKTTCSEGQTKAFAKEQEAIVREAALAASAAADSAAADLKAEAAKKEVGAKNLFGDVHANAAECKKTHVHNAHAQERLVHKYGAKADDVQRWQSFGWVNVDAEPNIRAAPTQAQSKDLLRQNEHWALRDEALEIFRMGDRSGDGQLDMNELTLSEISQSVKLAQPMMDPAQATMEHLCINKTGRVSEGEWLAHVKRLADNDEKSTAAALALYREHLRNSIIAQGVVLWMENEVHMRDSSRYFSL